jgi:transcriptional regulator with XRE-family HTH domain
VSDVALVIRGRILGRTGKGRELRVRAGLSLRELAEIVEVDAGTLSRWERGDVRPRKSGATRWVEACQEIERALAESS